MKKLESSLKKINEVIKAPYNNGFSNTEIEVENNIITRTRCIFKHMTNSGDYIPTERIVRVVGMIESDYKNKLAGINILERDHEIKFVEFIVEV